MEIVLISIGKISSSWINNGITEYLKRLTHYIKFTNLELPDIRNKKKMSPDSQKDEEGKIILNEINDSDYVILFDEKGSEFTSESFSQWIMKTLNTGRKRLIFVIGGPYGFSKALYQRKDYMLALSKMTFTHEMAKLFATEQIYRAFTIIRGEPYHHQ